MTSRKTFYVDNIISSCSSEEAATQYYQQARQIMKEAMRSWVSNSSALNTLATQDVNAGPHTTVNILGVQWTPQTDQVHLATTKFTSINNLITKREVLQQSCKVFDPLGLATPISITAKILIQRLWKENVDWDEPLNDVLCEEWSSIFADLMSVSELTMAHQYYDVKLKGSAQNYTCFVMPTLWHHCLFSSEG